MWLLRNTRLCSLRAYDQSCQWEFRAFFHRQKECTFKINSKLSAGCTGWSRINHTQPLLQGFQRQTSGYPQVRTLFYLFGRKVSTRTNARPFTWKAYNQCAPASLNVQNFHTSGPLRAMPAPFIWLVLKPLQKILAIILGRSLRKWWAALPANRRELLWQATWRRRWHLAAGGAGLLVVLAVFCLTHLDESPVTGRTRLLVFSRQNFMELARLTSQGYMEEFKESFVSPEDPRHKVVETVVRHLAQRNQDITEVATVPWSVHVVESPTINAFVLSNGKVFIFTGMLEAVADVHQLTFILGHEMAHAVIGHSAEQASMSHVVDFLSLILLTAIWAICPRDSLAVLGQWVQGKLVQFMFDRPYSRKLEAEADQVGLLLAAKACADVRAGPVFWQQMEIWDQLRGEPTVPEWLSTHPSHSSRVNQLDRLVPEALELRAKCDCPALPGTDPRAVFTKSVRLLLESAKDKGEEGVRRGAGGAALPLPQAPGPSLPGTPPQLGGVLGVPASLPQALACK